jgi:hypothetical protein
MAAPSLLLSPLACVLLEFEGSVKPLADEVAAEQCTEEDGEMNHGWYSFFLVRTGCVNSKEASGGSPTNRLFRGQDRNDAQGP